MCCENRKSVGVRYILRQYVYFPGLLATVFVAALGAGEMSLTTMRETDMLDQPAAEPLAVQEQSPSRRIRDHPVQAPTIPHAIKGYPINKEINQCLACHDKNVAPLVKAPTIAVSHFQNRDGVYLANVSPRRYFCTQCHVVQTVTE